MFVEPVKWDALLRCCSVCFAVFPDARLLKDFVLPRVHPRLLLAALLGRCLGSSRSDFWEIPSRLEFHCWGLVLFLKLSVSLRFRQSCEALRFLRFLRCCSRLPFTPRFEILNRLMKFLEALLLKPLQYVLRPSAHWWGFLRPGSWSLYNTFWGLQLIDDVFEARLLQPLQYVLRRSTHWWGFLRPGSWSLYNTFWGLQLIDEVFEARLLKPLQYVLRPSIHWWGFLRPGSWSLYNTFWGLQLIDEVFWGPVFEASAHLFAVLRPLGDPGNFNNI